MAKVGKTATRWQRIVWLASVVALSLTLGCGETSSSSVVSNSSPKIEGSQAESTLNSSGRAVALPSSSPSPTPSTAPAANLCGAPHNPWNYNFCDGNLIASPSSDFCSYFNC